MRTGNEGAIIWQRLLPRYKFTDCTDRWDHLQETIRILSHTPASRLQFFRQHTMVVMVDPLLMVERAISLATRSGHAVARQFNGHKVKQLKESLDEIDDSIAAAIPLRKYRDAKHWARIKGMIVELYDDHNKFREWFLELNDTQRFYQFWMVRTNIRKIRFRIRAIMDEIQTANFHSKREMAQHDHLEELERIVPIETTLDALRKFLDGIDQADDKDLLEYEGIRTRLLMILSGEIPEDVLAGEADSNVKHRSITAAENMLREAAEISARGARTLDLDAERASLDSNNSGGSSIYGTAYGGDATSDIGDEESNPDFSDEMEPSFALDIGSMFTA
ncbi:hypothetical protein EVG20_g11506 [Dentipellis fragilis]|uniref:Uncharacterized protein n=1 Tax=Dentipellis fragilis TaxID=205917 RepID=A0A4Y9XKE5_9AGAM|nr:hypothetical protein EVG20_g11506 [Dentipellis fragilis]